MSFNAKNTRKQGEIGLGAAIAFFMARGDVVCVPLSEGQDFDLVVEADGVLKRVQVKTTSYKDYGNIFQVNLAVRGGNQSYSTKKFFNNKSVDYVFILTSYGDKYLIPALEIQAKNCINLGDKYQKFRV